MNVARLLPAVVFSVLIFLHGCTIAVPVEPVRDGDLQSQIRAGQLLARGDRVEITTVGNMSHRLRVKEVTDEQILGYLTSVRIDDITAVGKREFSAARTVVLIGGVVLGLYVAGEGAKNSAL
jgi:hypothetical protein